MRNVTETKEVITDMNLFFRILLAVYAFCLTIVSIITMLITFRPYIFDLISNYLSESVLPNRNASFIMFLIAFLFFALSLTFLLSGVKSDKDRKAINKFTNIGEIRISLNSIESIALATSRRLNGIRDTKVDVRKVDDSVSIIVRAVILPDINIPVLSEEIQVKVKKSVEESSGIKVNDVRVLVENIHTGYKARVE